MTESRGLPSSSSILFERHSWQLTITASITTRSRRRCDVAGECIVDEDSASDRLPIPASFTKRSLRYSSEWTPLGASQTRDLFHTDGNVRHLPYSGPKWNEAMILAYQDFATLNRISIPLLLLCRVLQQLAPEISRPCMPSSYYTPHIQ